MISMLIFFVGLVALIGMSTQANNQLTQSKSRNDASNLASELIGDIWVSGATPATYNTGAWLSRVQNTLPGGNATVTPNGDQVQIVITWTDAKDPGIAPRYDTTAQITRNP